MDVTLDEINADVSRWEPHLVILGAGASRAAIFFSLINSCRLNKVNTWHYFNDVLARIQGTPKEKLTQLLPHKWTTTNVKAAA